MRSDQDELVDRHVGERLRLRRTILGLSQEQVAGSLGLSFQQLQKYERGANRVSASTLHELCSILDVPIGYFFDGLDIERPTPSADGDLMRREIMELARAFSAIQSERLKKNLLELTRALGS